VICGFGSLARSFPRSYCYCSAGQLAGDLYARARRAAKFGRLRRALEHIWDEVRLCFVGTLFKRDPGRVFVGVSLCAYAFAYALVIVEGPLWKWGVGTEVITSGIALSTMFFGQPRALIGGPDLGLDQRESQPEPDDCKLY